MKNSKLLWTFGAVVAAGSLLTGCTATGADASPVATPRATTTATTTARPAAQHELASELAALEQSYGARIGVTAVDTGAGRSVSYRGDERFAFDSTGKLFTASTVLSTETDAQLDAVVHYSTADLQSYSPITSQHVTTGMTVRALLAAALQYSDNTAANLLFEQSGGPAGVQKWLRDHGDRTSNVDRSEPTLNSAVPGDPRDTTTPEQMAIDLGHEALGGWLAPTRRADLVSTMLGNTTGAPYIRAGVPSTWKVADKTGNGDWGTRNDVAVVYPPHHAPILITVYTARHSADANSSNDLIARTTTDVVGALGVRQG